MKENTDKMPNGETNSHRGWFNLHVLTCRSQMGQLLGNRQNQSPSLFGLSAHGRIPRISLSSGNSIDFTRETKMTSKRAKFKSADDQSFVAMKCPSCSKDFGLKADFMDEVSGVPYHYVCPYCGYEASVESQ